MSVPPLWHPAAIEIATEIELAATASIIQSKVEYRFRVMRRQFGFRQPLTLPNSANRKLKITTNNRYLSQSIHRYPPPQLGT